MLSKLTTFLVLLNMIPLVVFFQVIIVPTLLPHLIGTPASWFYSTAFSAVWNIALYIVIKVRDRQIAKQAGY